MLGITGSVGKTSVKDIARALLPGRVHANRENLNTEIGLPLTLLEAPAETELLVLEMAMRGPGQIADLAEGSPPSQAAMVQASGVLQSAVALAGGAGQSTFDPELQATITTQAGGGYTLTDETGESPGTLAFNSAGKVTELRTGEDSPAKRPSTTPTKAQSWPK